MRFGCKNGSILAGYPVGLCSTYNLEVLQWWYDLAVKMFPVLWYKSNRLVKKNFGFRYRASDIIPTYHFFTIWVESGYLMKRYQDPKQDLDLVWKSGEII